MEFWRSSLESLVVKKKLLILGGQGFIGSHLVALALQKKYQVTVLSVKKEGFSISIPGVEQVEIVTADATNSKDLQAVLKKKSFHYVINCAGYIDHKLYKNGGRQLVDQHFTLVMNLVEYLNRESLESFIQIGSSDEYGNLPSPQIENSRESPISPYSFGKVAATHFLQMLHRTENFPVVIVRIFLTYGPGQDNRRFLPQIIQGCLQNESFSTSEGEQVRDFCYISDITEGIFQVLETPAAKGQIINLASGKSISIRTIIDTICKMIGKGNPEYGKIPYRSGENMELYANIEKAYKLLGWVPTTSLEDGVKKTIHYYQQQLEE